MRDLNSQQRGGFSQKESTSRDYIIPDDDDTIAVRDSTRMEGMLDSQLNGSSDISKVIDKNLEQYKKDLQSKRSTHKEDPYNEEANPVLDMENIGDNYSDDEFASNPQENFKSK